MKIIDNNGRLFGKISVIDVIVILVVAALALALNLKTNTLTHTSTATPDQTISYKIYGRGVPSYVVDNLLVGDKLFDEDRTNSGCLGEITGVEVLPGTEQVAFPDGTVQIVPSQDTVDLVISVEGKGLIDGKRVSLNRVYDLGVNSARSFCTHYARFTGTVSAIG